MKRRFFKIFVFSLSLILINNTFAMSTENINQVTNDKLALDSLIALKTQFIKNLEKIFMCKNYWELRYYSPTVDNKVADFVFNSSDNVKQKVEKLDAIKIRYSIYLGKIDELISVITRNNSSEDLISEVDFCINSFFSKNIYPGTNGYQKEFELFKNYDSEQMDKIIEANRINIATLKIYFKSLLKEFDVPNYFERNWLKITAGSAGIATSAYLIYKNKDKFRYQNTAEQRIKNKAEKIIAKFKDETAYQDLKNKEKLTRDDLFDLAEAIFSEQYKGNESNKTEILDKKEQINEKIDDIQKNFSKFTEKTNLTLQNLSSELKDGINVEKIKELKTEFNKSYSSTIEELKKIINGTKDSIKDESKSEVIGLFSKILNFISGGYSQQASELVDRSFKDANFTLDTFENGLFAVNKTLETFCDVLETTGNLNGKLNNLGTQTIDIAGNFLTDIDSLETKLKETLNSGFDLLQKSINLVDDYENRIPDIAAISNVILSRLFIDVSNTTKNIIFAIASITILGRMAKRILATHSSKMKNINSVEIEICKILIKYQSQTKDVFFDSINYADKGLFIYYMEKLQNLSNGILGQDKINLIKLIDALNDKSKTIYEKVNLIKLEQNSMLVGA